MPICKREGFDNAPSKNNKDDTFHDNDEVFFCEVTKEIFRDYEDYFRHVMVINSTVWQCEATGRDNLTYAEALRSERRARKKMELFKDNLRPPVMLVIEHAKQSSLKALNSMVCKFLRKRFFLNEEVTACNKSSTYNAYTVMEILPPGKCIPGNGVYEETEKLQYKLRRIGNLQTEITVPYENIRRQRFEFTTENLQMFIKNNITRVDGILKPKPESFKKYVTDRKINFASIFIGKMPHFTPAKIKRPVATSTVQSEYGKKQSTMNKYFMKNSNDDKQKSAEELAKREKEKEAKAKSLKEEMERIRREKQEKLLELERQRAEKRALLMEKIEAECTALLTKTDDLERTDQRMLPMCTSVQTYIPTKLLGDAFAVREFMHSFGGVLSGIEVFRGNLSFKDMSRAFTVREVAGPLSDILLILLGTVFDLQKEEEEECTVEYRKEMRKNEPFATMSQAALTHFYSKRHFYFKVNELPIDALTLSEVLRLHLLASGASVKERADKWRVMYRNGYSSSEDPGLELRMQHPHILRALKMYTIYNLPFVDIIRILRCLMSQILTYSSPINLIEERMEHMAKARYDLKNITIIENRRVSHVQAQKRALTNEHNQQCLDDAVKNDEVKKRQLEEKLNKKVAELLAQSERDHRKYEQQVEKLNAALFNFLVFLGMDRAYRKYYVLESIPGIFIEHPLDCMDTCLSDPPQNALNQAHNTAILPKTRKELRSYLLRVYTDEEKRTSSNASTKSNTKNRKLSSACQENKENHLLVNGVINGQDTSTIAAATTVAANEDDTLVVDGEEAITPPTETLPTQYQLYMCTGDRHNCVVHDKRNADRQRWAYLYKKEDIEALIDALNPLGDRESQLREQLSILRQLILDHVKKCPFDMLSIEGKHMSRLKNVLMTETNKYNKYYNSNFGFREGVDLNEVMYSALVDRILQFESDIYTGDLGRLKVKDMVKWRIDVQKNTYDSQCKLLWGPAVPAQKVAVTAAGEDEEDIFDDVVEGDDLEVNIKDEGEYANKRYRDPGEGLGESMEIDSEDSEDEGISLHDSVVLRTCVKNLASALLQVEQAIERRFIKEPFGAPVKEAKDKEFLERKQKSGANRLKQWEVSLMESTSYSQVFLHLNILHDCILWARSTNKSSCQVCRRGSDPDKMLLCDECNGGTHMFCMKPKMKTVPDGNWYCKRCVKLLGLQNENDNKKKVRSQKHKRTFIMDEEDNCSESSSVSSTSNTKEHVDRRGRGSGRQRSNKRLQSNDIEEALKEIDESGDDDVNDEDDSREKDEEEEIEYEEDQEIEEDDTPDEGGDEDVSEHNEQDDESVCIVCSYDGSDLLCGRCKDAFHLECINLKRPPRYNFICTNCKSKEDKKRKAKAHEKNSIDGSSEEDNIEDNEDDDLQPPQKRQRQSRSSLRNSMPNENITGKVSSQRRSNRRTGDHLPLNSSALYELLDDIMKHQSAWPFLRPVSQAEVKDYYKIIKNPMDFAKVKSKLNMGQYQLNEEVMSDIQLIFHNCDKYNVEGNEIYVTGLTLEQFTIERCKQLNLPFKPSDMNAKN